MPAGSDPTAERSEGRVRGVLWHVMPAVLYAAGIFWGGGARITGVPSVTYGDKIVHLLAFAGMQLLAYRAMRFLWPTLSRSSAVVGAASLASVLGGLLEGYQALIPYRSADLLDWLADTLGAALAALILYLVLRTRDPAVAARSSG